MRKILGSVGVHCLYPNHPLKGGSVRVQNLCCSMNTNVHQTNHKQGASIALHYRLFGHGPTRVIFIMGLSAQWIAWKPQIDYFSSFPDEYTICCFDNRGCGNSEAPVGRYTTKMLAADALSLLSYLEWNGVHVVGMSLGGMIATELALTMLTAGTPKLLSLTLVSTHTGNGLRSMLPPLSGVTDLMKGFIVRTPEGQMELLLHVMFSKKHLMSPSDNPEFSNNKSKWKAYFNSPAFKDHITLAPLHGIAGQMSAVMTHCVRPSRLRELDQSGIPILLMTGTGDKLVHFQNTVNMMRWMPNADVKMFEGAGHCINMECAEGFNMALSSHFRSAAIP